MNTSWRLTTRFLFSPDNDENIVLSLLTLVVSIIPHRLGHMSHQALENWTGGEELGG